MNARPARVHIDAASHAEVFPCTLPVPTVRWNGWECPTFDRPTVERLIAWVTREPGSVDYEFIWTTDYEGTDCLLMGSVDGFEIWWELIGDDKVGYGLGAWAWCWVELEESAPTDPEQLDAYLTGQIEASAVYSEAWNTALKAAYDGGADANEACRAARAAAEATGAFA